MDLKTSWDPENDPGETKVAWPKIGFEPPNPPNPPIPFYSGNAKTCQKGRVFSYRQHSFPISSFKLLPGPDMRNPQVEHLHHSELR